MSNPAEDPKAVRGGGGNRGGGGGPVAGGGDAFGGGGEDFRADALLLVLKDEGYISELQARQIMDEHSRCGLSTRDLVIEQGYVEEPALLIVIAGQLGTSVVDLASYEIDPHDLCAIPGSMARMYNVFVVEDTAAAMVLATYELLPLAIRDEIGFVLGKDISFVVASKESVRGMIAEHYEPS